MSDSKRFLTTGDVAKLTGVTRTTVLHWIKSGKLRAALTTAGGHYRIAEADLAEFLKERGAPPQAQRKQRILVVDDDPAILDLVVRILRPVFPNCTFETAADGVDAGLKLLRFAPDLLILDLLLPGVDGFEVCRLVRSDPDLRDTAILCITGHTEPGVRELAMSAGADECLLKPLEVEVLRHHVRQLLGRLSEERA